MIARQDKNKRLLVKVYLLLAIVENLAALLYLAWIPSDSKNAVILGYSATRLGLLAGMAVVFFITCLLLIRASLSEKRMGESIRFLERVLSNQFGHRIIVYGFSSVLVSGIVILLFPVELLRGALYAFERLVPVIAWAIAFSLQTLIWQFIWRQEKLYLGYSIHQSQFLRITAALFALSLILAGAMIWTGLGLDPDRSGWYSPGTPILFGQVLLGWLFGIVLVFREQSLLQWFSRLKFQQRFINLDVLLCLLLWLGACLLWSAEPMKKWSYFTSPPTAPNHEYYPYSDAALYDEAAQGLLIGISRDSSVMLRPLYSFFLALLHAIGGQDYPWIVQLQILVLGIAPALLYLLGSRLGNRPTGLVAAILMILRERNSIALTNVIEVSHSKLLLSDVPAMGLMVLFIYVLIAWLRGPRSQIHRGVFAGAALGLVILVRSQAQLLIPVMLIIFILVDRFQWRGIFQKLVVFMLGVLVVIAPWIWRNYQISGNAAVENPEFYIRILASGYVHSQSEIQMLAGENSAEYYERMKSQIVQFIIDNPAEVARFYAAHFIHNEIGSVIYLPLTPKWYPLNVYIHRQMFWNDPSKNPASDSFVALLINLGLISAGIAAAYRRVKWIGLAPLFIHMGYCLSVVPMRLSGWRFVLPVDWIPLLYYSIGLMVLSMMLISVFSKKGIYRGLDESPEIAMEDSETIQPAKPSYRGVFLALLIPVVFGLSLPLTEIVTPLRYSKLSQDQIVREYVPGEILLSDGNILQHSDLLAFLENQTGAVVLYGRALYPGYYERGAFWGDQNVILVEASAYDRLQFRLIGPAQASVFLPLSQPPQSFPHASDVLVIGCSTNYAIQALLIRVGGRGRLLNGLPMAWLELFRGPLNLP